VRQPKPVTDYLAVLARELDFDPALSRRVCCEVEDHLWHAVEARGGPSVENQRQAILGFGEARELACGYVAASMLAQIRWAGGAMILAATAIYVAMKARVAWYGWMRWEPTPDYMAVSAFALPIDRYATMLAIIGALIGCGYIATRRAPSWIGLTASSSIVASFCAVRRRPRCPCVSPPRLFSPASGCRERSGVLQLWFLCCRYWSKSRRSSGWCFLFAQQSDARNSRPHCYEIRRSPILARYSPASGVDQLAAGCASPMSATPGCRRRRSPDSRRLTHSIIMPSIAMHR
jgi:hypothetical protein